jgi:hypothetical protein
MRSPVRTNDDLDRASQPPVSRALPVPPPSGTPLEVAGGFAVGLVFGFDATCVTEQPVSTVDEAERVVAGP